MSPLSASELERLHAYEQGIRWTGRALGTVFTTAAIGLTATGHWAAGPLLLVFQAVGMLESSMKTRGAQEEGFRLRDYASPTKRWSARESFWAGVRREAVDNAPRRGLGLTRFFAVGTFLMWASKKLEEKQAKIAAAGPENLEASPPPVVPDAREPSSKYEA